MYSFPVRPWYALLFSLAQTGFLHEKHGQPDEEQVTDIITWQGVQRPRLCLTPLVHVQGCTANVQALVKTFADVCSGPMIIITACFLCGHSQGVFTAAAAALSITTGVLSHGELGICRASDISSD